MISKIFSLRNFVAKQLTKSNPEGIMKLPNKGQIDFGEMMIREELFKRGIDVKSVTSERQLERILHTPIPTPPTPKSADVLDLTGKKIDTDKPIVGGKNIDWEAVEKTDIEEFAQGGRTGLSYLLAEDTNERMPFAGGKLAQKLIQEIIRKYKGRIDDRLLNQMLADDNPQRLAEVMATVDEALIMQQKGMKPDQIVETVRESFKRKKQAEGGITRVPLADGKQPFYGEIVDTDWDEETREHMELIRKLLLAGEIPQYAGGGRVPFKIGGINKMRRAFLKAAGAGAAGIGAAKTGLFGLLKGGGKQVAKDLTQVPIGDPVGMPPWFKPLVNRVIKEGDDVTKKFATKEREIVHSAKLGEEQGVKVTQDLDEGVVRVEYDSTTNMGEQSIQLEYKASQEIPLHSPEGSYSKVKHGSKKSVKTEPTFSAVEAEPRVMNWDGDIEWDGENVVSEVKDLMSDTSALKQYGSGKDLTKKELAIAKQKQKKVKNLNEDQGAQGDFIEEKYGPAPDDVPDHIPSGYDKMKSGGRAGYVLGGKVGMRILKLLKDKKKLKAAYDDIFPTDDYKYDAEMVAESLVENNPKVFGNRLYEDLTDRERMAVYGAALDEASANFARQLKMKRAMDKASRPTKTLKGIEETGTINISDDAVAEEFANFMKEADPVGYAKIQKVVDDANQRLELQRFKTKGRKKNASGGLAKLLGE